MQVMKCPECGERNPVAREYCGACGEYLWPRAECQHTGHARLAVSPAQSPPAGLRATAARLLRRLFGPHSPDA
jgi:hypothetical protein